MASSGHILELCTTVRCLKWGIDCSLKRSEKEYRFQGLGRKTQQKIWGYPPPRNFETDVQH